MIERRLFLTGGSGFLGSRIAVLAAARGWQVWATHLTNPVPDADGITPVHLDLATGCSELDSLLRAVRPHAVVHAAYSMSDAALNIEATRALASTCASLERLPFVLYTSTDLVFDGHQGGYKEQDEPRPVMDYGRQKLQAELEVLEHVSGAAIVRTSLIYDLSRQPRHLDFAVRATGRGEEFSFFEDEYRCPVQADELAGAILELCSHELGGIWHAAGADRVDRWWFGTRLMVSLGHSIQYARPGRSADLPGERPEDCSLDCGKLFSKLNIKLSGAKQILGKIDEGV